MSLALNLHHVEQTAMFVHFFFSRRATLHLTSLIGINVKSSLSISFRALASMFMDSYLQGIIGISHIGRSHMFHPFFSIGRNFNLVLHV